MLSLNYLFIYLFLVVINENSLARVVTDSAVDNYSK